MKTAVIILTLIALVSCRSGVDPELLTGSWKSADDLSGAGLNSYSSLTFSADDSVKAKTFAYGKLTSEVGGLYKVDKTARTLTTAYGDTVSYELEIVKLTGTELELYYPETKQYQKYVRLDRQE